MAKIIGNTTATPNPRPDWNQTDVNKADYIKNKPTIKSGVGINSIKLNDIDNNKAYGNNAVAAGFNTKAGSNAFKILAVSGNIMKLSSVEGLTIGMECSCQYQSNFDLFGKITGVNTEHNTVAFDNMPSDVFTEGQTNILWAPSNPELGDGETVVGTGAFAMGYDNKANQIGAFAAGYNNVAAGKYSAAFGKGNIVSYAGFTTGNSNIVKGTFNTAFGNSNEISDGEASFVSGVQNKLVKGVSGAFTHGMFNQINSSHSYAIGTGNITSKQGQIVIGKYNKDDVNPMFILGWGSDDTNRKNLLTVDETGKILVNQLSSISTGAYTNSWCFDSLTTDNTAVSGVAIGQGNHIYSPSGFVGGVNSTSGVTDDSGKGVWASGLNSNIPFAFGWYVTSKGKYTAAFGNNTIASGNSQFVVGKMNREGTDYLFAVGNGSSANSRTNALEVKNNGAVLGGKSTSDNDNIKTLTTKDYVDTKVAEAASGKITKTIKTHEEIEALIANPSTASTDIIYMVKDEFVDGDTYKEYTLINDEIVQIGDTSTDLSDYYNKTETDELLGDKANKATTLSGYGITDVYTKTEIDAIIGNIETALDSIIAIQESYLGGAE